MIAQEQAAQPKSVVRHITQGPATPLQESIFQCGVQGIQNSRKTATGRITATDGTVLTVPADTAFTAGPKASDLYNECNGKKPKRLIDISVADLPIVEVDADGEVVTGYVVADNYFELYINDKLVAVDPLPYTPFNSAIVRFRVKKPYTYALKVVDWEEKLGLGMEWFPPNHDWWTGDGGLIARFSDGVVTDASWKAQTFYISPLKSPNDVIERGNVHDTSALGRFHPQAKQPDCQLRCFAVHYPIPHAWSSPKFDDRAWPSASEFTDAQVGISPALISYTQFPEAFVGAQWIWSSNLVFDNLVLLRKTVH